MVRRPPPDPLGGLGTLAGGVATGFAQIPRIPGAILGAAGNLARYAAGDQGAGYRSSAAERQTGQEAADKRYGLRRSAIAGKREEAALLGRQVGAAEKQAGRNQEAIRQGAGKATAMGLDPGRAGGGANIAAVGQVGMDAKSAGITQAGSDLEFVQRAQTRAAEARYKADEYAAQQGTEAEDYAAAIGAGVTDAEAAIQGGQGFWDDDEEAMMRNIRAIVARLRVQSPRAAIELEQKYLTPGGEGYKRIHSWWD